MTAWISESAAEERAALAELDHLAVQAPAPLSASEALAVVDQLGGMPGLLQQADQDDQAALYAALDVSATYDPATRSAEFTVSIPRSAKNVSEGGLEPPRPEGHQPLKLARLPIPPLRRGRSWYRRRSRDLSR